LESDEVYGQLLPIEEDISNPIYGIAFNFWDACVMLRITTGSIMYRLQEMTGLNWHRMSFNRFVRETCPQMKF
jgi:hypothetical protein